MLLIVYSCLPEKVFLPLNKLTALTAGGLLTLSGEQAVVSGTIISLGSFTVNIITECSILFPATLYVSFVIAYPLSVRHKITGLLLGVSALFCCNAFRIALLTWCGFAYPPYFEYLHVYFGQILMMLAVIAACLLWLGIAPHEQEGSGLVHFMLRLLLYSAVLFGIWSGLNRPYVTFIDGVIQYAFTWFNYQLFIPLEHTVYYQTFNIVLFCALLFSSRFKSNRRRFAGLVAGGATMFVAHLLFRLCNVFMTGFDVADAYSLSLMLATAGQYVLPIGLWLLLLSADNNGALPYFFSVSDKRLIRKGSKHE